jgi:rhodanese-related sulfurtransferase
VLIVAEDDARVAEAVMRLARVGLENVAGSLAGGAEAWRASGRPLATIPQITVADLQSLLGKGDLQVIDVRRAGEYAGGHVPGAVHAPLDRLTQESARLDPSRPTAVICAGGYRSSLGTSVLAGRGFADLRNVLGGTGAWVSAGYDVGGGRTLAGRETLEPSRQPAALRFDVEPAVARRVALEALERAAHHALGARGVPVVQVVVRDGHLDEALEEIARGPADAAPHVLEGVVAFEEEPGVELADALGQRAPLLVVERRLGRRLGHGSRVARRDVRGRCCGGRDRAAAPDGGRGCAGRSRAPSGRPWPARR